MLPAIKENLTILCCRIEFENGKWWNSMYICCRLICSLGQFVSTLVDLYFPLLRLG